MDLFYLDSSVPEQLDWLDERRTHRQRAHIWIASLNALVVLALSASLLLLVVLYWFPNEHASLANRGFPVALMWVVSSWAPWCWRGRPPGSSSAGSRPEAAVRPQAFDRLVADLAAG